MHIGAPLVPGQGAAPAKIPPPPWQAPPVQIAFEPHVLPHPPQLAESLVTSVQYILPVGASTQTMVGAAHAGEPMQKPPWQLVPAAQTLPQTPQLAGSLSRFAHQVVPVAVVHEPNPEAQVVPPLPPLPPTPEGVLTVPPLPLGEEQTPDWQAEVAGQVRLQPPQFALSVMKSVHQNAPVALWQPAKPAGQVLAAPPPAPPAPVPTQVPA